MSGARISIDDILTKRFNVTRHGYDMGEVDEFLDAVTVELRTLYAEIAQLRAHQEFQPYSPDASQGPFDSYGRDAMR